MPKFSSAKNVFYY